MKNSISIQALVKTCGEPQIPRCLEAVWGQNRPYDKITISEMVVPESEARRRLVADLTCDWFMTVAGDMILNPDATQIAEDHILKYQKEFMAFRFGLWDGFLDAPICCCSAVKSKLYASYEFRNELSNDTMWGRHCKKQGWKGLKRDKKIFIGTHCEDPDDFQVFRRFYSRGVKAGRKGNNKNLQKHLGIFNKLFSKTGNKQYRLAMRAIKLGFEWKFYPTSHNLKFDRFLFDSVLADKSITLNRFKKLLKRRQP